MAVQRYDDLNGKAGAEEVAFALDGKAWVIDLCPENAAAFRAMFAPYLTKARPAQDPGGVVLCLPARLNHETGLLTLTDGAGSRTRPAVATATGGGGFLFAEGDRFGRPVLKLAADDVTDIPEATESPAAPQASPPGRPDTPPADEPTQPSNASATDVRNWAKRWSVPGLPARGRVPEKIRTIHDSFHNDNKEPWKELLREHGIDPVEAEAKARALTAVDSSKQAGPTQEELDRKEAARVGKLSGAQLTRLRRMFSAPDGRATSDRKNGDATSFEALAHRGCCILVDTDEQARTSTYEITNVGRLWFDVRGVNPVGN